MYIWLCPFVILLSIYCTNTHDGCALFIRSCIRDKRIENAWFAFDAFAPFYMRAHFKLSLHDIWSRQFSNIIKKIGYGLPMSDVNVPAKLTPFAYLCSMWCSAYPTPL